MQCYHHPGWDAWTQCNRCREPLCYECAIRRDGYFLCSWCFALESVTAEKVPGRDMETKTGNAGAFKERNLFKRKLLRMLQL
jgi:hypothetical protein